MISKKLFVAAMMLLAVSSAYAADLASCREDKDDEKSEKEERPDKVVRKKFFNFSYLYDKISLSDKEFSLSDLGAVVDETEAIANDQVAGIRNNYGFSLTRGRTYAFHQKPIARLVTIGLDAVFFDVAYSNYTLYPSVLGAHMSDEDGNMTLISGERDMHRIEYSLQVGPSVTITPGQQLTVAAYFRYAPTFSGLLLEKSFSCNYASMFVTGASVAFGKMGVGIEARLGSCEYKNVYGPVDFSGGKISSSGFRAFLQIRW